MELILRIKRSVGPYIFDIVCKYTIILSSLEHMNIHFNKMLGVAKVAPILMSMLLAQKIKKNKLSYSKKHREIRPFFRISTPLISIFSYL